jgi:hypothetical protein
MPITSTATLERITQFLASYISQWPRDPYWPPRTWYSGISWAAPPVASYTTPAELVQDLLANAEFRALQLGTWLNKPDGELIAAAVEAITPPPYREDIELITEALTLAARCQRGDGIGRAILTGGTAVGLTLLIAACKN